MPGQDKDRGIRKTYLAKLHLALQNAKSKIQSRLPEELFKEVLSLTYYFAPEGRTSDFSAFYQ